MLKNYANDKYCLSLAVCYMVFLVNLNFAFYYAWIKCCLLPLCLWCCNLLS